MSGISGRRIPASSRTLRCSNCSESRSLGWRGAEWGAGGSTGATVSIFSPESKVFLANNQPLIPLRASQKMLIVCHPHLPHPQPRYLSLVPVRNPFYYALMAPCGLLVGKVMFFPSGWAERCTGRDGVKSTSNRADKMIWPPCDLKTYQRSSRIEGKVVTSPPPYLASTSRGSDPRETWRRAPHFDLCTSLTRVASSMNQVRKAF